MKKIFKLGFIFLIVSCLTGCIEVTRGYKSTVFMMVEGESKSTYTASPTLDVNADKKYSDAFKADANAGQPDKEQDKQQKTE